MAEVAGSGQRGGTSGEAPAAKTVEAEGSAGAGAGIEEL